MAHDILIVDDEPDIRLLIDGILRDEGYETRGAGDADAAIAAFRMRRPSLVDPGRVAARLAHGRARHCWKRFTARSRTYRWR